MNLTLILIQLTKSHYRIKKPAQKKAQVQHYIELKFNRRSLQSLSTSVQYFLTLPNPSD